ncbi:O-antigen ligase family protein [Chloroflexi bacterium TSY]|nr:O-antigen ligase family protein [Chloroflexi bacterium TSY]
MIWSNEQHLEKPTLLWTMIALVAGTTSSIIIILTGDPLLIVFGMIGLAILGITLFNTEIALLVLVFMIYARVSDVLYHHHGVPSIAKVYAPLLLLIVVARWFLFKERPLGWERPLIFVVAYVTVGMGSLLFAANQTRAQHDVTQLVKDVLIVVAVVMLLQRGSTLRRVIWTLLSVGIFLGSLSVYQQITGSFDNNFWGFATVQVEHIIGQSNSPRISGPLSPNFFALVMVVLVPLALERFWNEESIILRILAAWSLTACVLTIVFTFSRGGFLAMGLVLALTMLRYPPKPMVVLITAVVVVLIVPFVPAQYMARMGTMFEALPFVGRDTGPSVVVEEVSFRGRLSEMTVAVQMFADHPLFGVGLGNYNSNYLDYSRGLGLDKRLEARSAHSLYLEVAAETGVVGLLTFGLLLWMAFTSVGQAHRLFQQAELSDYANITSAISIGLIGYFTGSIFLHAAFPRYFWLLLGIAFAIPQVAEHEAEKVQQDRK